MPDSTSIAARFAKKMKKNSSLWDFRSPPQPSLILTWDREAVEVIAFPDGSGLLHDNEGSTTQLFDHAIDLGAETAKEDLARLFREELNRSLLDDPVFLPDDDDWDGSIDFESPWTRDSFVQVAAGIAFASRNAARLDEFAYLILNSLSDHALCDDSADELPCWLNPEDIEALESVKQAAQPKGQSWIYNDNTGERLSSYDPYPVEISISLADWSAHERLAAIAAAKTWLETGKPPGTCRDQATAPDSAPLSS